MVDIMLYSFPKDDLEAWDRYPKLRWVYDTTRLLEAQNIKWFPYKTKENCAFMPRTSLKLKEITFTVRSTYPDRYMASSEIFVKEPSGDHLYTDVIIQDGHIKYSLHSNANRDVVDGEIGNVILRINAFVTLYFQKFSGVVCFETYGNSIYALKLRPSQNLLDDYSEDAIKLIKKIFKKVKVADSAPAQETS